MRFRALAPFFLSVLLPAALSAVAPADEAVLRGREVYVAEGCVHCHTQRVRPDAGKDLLWWGPVAGGDERVEGHRRLGPDLAAVGNRRSPEWNRLHLEAPRRMMTRSRMPAYPQLFAPGQTRGEDLVAYLGSLGADTAAARQAAIARWEPTRGVEAPGISRTRKLFAELCASCHGTQGRGDGSLAARLVAKPADLQRRPLTFVGSDSSGQPRLDQLQRLIKFGLPNSAMAGHEYLQDDDLLGLAQFVAGLDRRAP